MRYVLRIIELVLLVLLIAVTVQNSHPVDFKLFFGQVWSAPLIVFLLVFFIAGAAVGLLATLSYYLRLRRQLSLLKKELRNRPPSPRVVHDPSDALAD
ncbi:lipopolysaccharide assembly LapA domain-containing protein [Pseudogulbenkiania sp. MAI-1]|uniref:LapA family protein n=1 Tax=Pseudogulbenkiania sp. MAI-1 TaxID=990370 RepID=UPI00045EAC02|nr:LapA family protein [Pseudogulbenkiania sp. MAI-1]